MADNARLEELRRRVQSDPASIAFAALAEEYRREGRFDEAIAACAAGLKRHPSYLSAHVTLGRALIEIGQYDEAREELDFVLRGAPENLAAIRALAELHHRRGDAVYLPEEDPLAGTPLADPTPPTTPTPTSAAEPSAAGSRLPASDEGVVVLGALEAFLGAVRRARASQPGGHH